jgi:hypothetical protein
VTSPAAPASYPLNTDTYQAILNGSGNATIQIQPGAAASPGSGVGASRRGGFSWDVQAIVPSVNPLPANPGVVKSCLVSVYVSFGIQQATPSALVGNTTLPTTATGPSSEPCLFPGNLVPGDWITVTFTGGDAGAIATVRIFGQANPPGVR